MDDEAGFEAFVTERWPVLVRSAVLLGCSRAEAEDVAQTTLVRCYAAWSKVTAADNRDGYVYRMLDNAHRDSRRRRWGGEAPTEFVDRTADDGLVALFIIVADHLFFEQWWRHTGGHDGGEWLGEEVEHGFPEDGQLSRVRRARRRGRRAA